jgi:hypothetical protein
VGDHRASIKIEIEFHGIKREVDMWINYWPYGCEYEHVDDRIIEFIRDVYHEGMAQYEEEMARIKECDRETEEKAEWKRLKEKYEHIKSTPCVG